MRTQVERDAHRIKLLTLVEHRTPGEEEMLIHLQARVAMKESEE